MCIRDRNITGSKSKIIHLPALEQGDMTRRLPDNFKMKSILKRDLISLEEGIKIVLASRQSFQKPSKLTKVMSQKTAAV